MPEKKVLINARVTPAGKTLLLKVGEGNINLGVERIMKAWTSMKQAMRPLLDEASQPPSSTELPA